MALASLYPITFSGAASDLFRNPRSEIRGIPLKFLGKARMRPRRMVFTVRAMILKKGKKFEYPWPDDPDLNVKGGILSYLSDFKPLKGPPKPVTLEFEKPLLGLEKKITDVRKMANETGLDFTDQISSLEMKYQQALTDLYTHLTPHQRLQIARHPNRPTCLDHVINIFDKWVELHGDRAGYDDPAIVCGLASLNGKTYVFIGHQKGRNTKENIQRNFGMPTPHGYRKALRLMHYADNFRFPIVTFIDTPGAYADLKSEELGQGEAIAQNLRSMFGLRVPIISIVIGEGGSGGALAIGCCNKMLMLENSVFYVASPEACAAILWKTAKAAPEAAEMLKITSKDLYENGISDGTIPEPLGGAHRDPAWTSEQIKSAILREMEELSKMDADALLEHRTEKYRHIGPVEEMEPPIPPEHTYNMMKSDLPVLERIPGSTSVQDFACEVNKIKDHITQPKEASEAQGSTPDPDELELDSMIEKLKVDYEFEFSKAVKLLRIQWRVKNLRDDLSKYVRDVGEEVLVIYLEKIKEFTLELAKARNFKSMIYKIVMWRDLVKEKTELLEKNKKAELKERIDELMDRPGVKEKVDTIEATLREFGTDDVDQLDDEVKEKILSLKKEVDDVIHASVKSFDEKILRPELIKEVAAHPSYGDLQAKMDELGEEVVERVEEYLGCEELRYMFDVMKMVLTTEEWGPVVGSGKVDVLETDLKEKLTDLAMTPEMSVRHDRLAGKMAEAMESMGLDGGPSMPSPIGDWVLK